MPVTNFDYRGMSSLPDVAQVLGIHSLLDEEDYNPPAHRQTASIDRSGMLHMERNEDEFPMLLHRQTDSSATHSKMPSIGQDGSGWPSARICDIVRVRRVCQ